MPFDLPDVRRDEDDDHARRSVRFPFPELPPEIQARVDAVRARRPADDGGPLPAHLMQPNCGGDPVAVLERPVRPRELEVVQLVAEGYSNGEIAARLHVSTETVKAHLRGLRAALGARDRTHAAVIALRRGLIA